MNDSNRFDRIEQKLDQFDAKLDKFTEFMAKQEKHSERLIILTERQQETASLAREAMAKANELANQITRNSMVAGGVKAVAGVVVGLLLAWVFAKMTGSA